MVVVEFAALLAAARVSRKLTTTTTTTTDSNLSVCKNILNIPPSPVLTNIIVLHRIAALFLLLKHTHRGRQLAPQVPVTEWGGFCLYL